MKKKKSELDIWIDELFWDEKDIILREKLKETENDTTS